MSHLHIPDGVLPAPLWLLGLVLAVSLLALTARAGSANDPRRVGFHSALGGLMLAVMSLPIPLFAMEYCVTLAGPMGVLVGSAGSIQVVFVVSLILALMGQGGLTVVGLNALVMGVGAAIARPVYRVCATRVAPPAALAFATAATQLVSGVLWFGVLALALRLDPSVDTAELFHGARAALFTGVTFAMWAAAVLIESAIAFGVGRFLLRVRPDLLPATAGTAPRTASRPAAS